MQHLRNNTGAILYYDKAFTIDPHYAEALNNKGAALDNLGNHTDAILYYDNALTINPYYDNALTIDTKMHYSTRATILPL